MARKGHDIFATAQTGTGKTAAFSLPRPSHLLNSGKKASRGTARGLILAPTRELAARIAQNIKDYVKYTELSVSAVYGGNKMSSQVRQLELGVDILVATRGRLEEHLEAGNVSIANLNSWYLMKLTVSLIWALSMPFARSCWMLRPLHKS